MYGGHVIIPGMCGKGFDWLLLVDHFIIMQIRDFGWLQGLSSKHTSQPKNHHIHGQIHTLGTFSIRFFTGKRQTANRKMSRDHGLEGHVCSLQFTFEPQEGLPAVSDLRQGFLPQKIVQPRV